MTTRVNITLVGPLWDGRAHRAISDALKESTAGVSEIGIIDLHNQFDRVFKNPTGYYKSQTIVEPSGADWRIHDQGVVYGPWLEGVGSRNHPVTRFKGYRSYRIVAQNLRRKVPQIIAPIFRRFLERL